MWTNLIAELQTAPWYCGQLIERRTTPAREAQHRSIPLREPLAGYLARRGITPYRHQAEAIAAFRDGQDIVITTPTASGKTLAFNLPVLESLSGDPNGTALYLYPLKALANDQLGKLQEIDEACDLNLHPRTYDGDTPASHRKRIRETSRIILTNAHALHQYLPWHPQWARIFANLRAIVIDEAHHYRGMFGANVAHLMRRFLRILE